MVFCRKKDTGLNLQLCRRFADSLILVDSPSPVSKRVKIAPSQDVGTIDISDDSGASEIHVSDHPEMADFDEVSESSAADFGNRDHDDDEDVFGHLGESM